jgi:hypothetical protein
MASSTSDLRQPQLDMCMDSMFKTRTYCNLFYFAFFLLFFSYSRSIVLLLPHNKRSSPASLIIPSVYFRLYSFITGMAERIIDDHHERYGATVVLLSFDNCMLCKPPFLVSILFEMSRCHFTFSLRQ